MAISVALPVAAIVSGTAIAAGCVLATTFLMRSKSSMHAALFFPLIIGTVIVGTLACAIVCMSVVSLVCQLLQNPEEVARDYHRMDGPEEVMRDYHRVQNPEEFGGGLPKAGSSRDLGPESSCAADTPPTTNIILPTTSPHMAQPDDSPLGKLAQRVQSGDYASMRKEIDTALMHTAEAEGGEISSEVRASLLIVKNGGLECSDAERHAEQEAVLDFFGGFRESDRSILAALLADGRNRLFLAERVKNSHMQLHIVPLLTNCTSGEAEQFIQISEAFCEAVQAMQNNKHFKQACTGADDAMLVHLVSSALAQCMQQVIVKTNRGNSLLTYAPCEPAVPPANIAQCADERRALLLAQGANRAISRLQADNDPEYSESVLSPALARLCCGKGTEIDVGILCHSLHVAGESYSANTIQVRNGPELSAAIAAHIMTLRGFSEPGLPLQYPLLPAKQEDMCAQCVYFENFSRDVVTPMLTERISSLLYGELKSTPDFTVNGLREWLGLPRQEVAKDRPSLIPAHTPNQPLAWR